MIVDTRVDVQERARDFLKNARGPIYIFGTNKYGENTKNWLSDRGFEIGGFINDFVNDKYYQGVRTFKSGEIGKNQDIINCIVEGRTIDAYKSISNLEPKSVIDYFALQLMDSANLQGPDFFENTSSINDDLQEYEKLNERLEDVESKSTLNALLNFRFNRDSNWMKDFSFRIQDQYFEPFVALSENPVFVDGGGFDGSTTKYFIERYPSYGRVLYFEPTRESMTRSKELLKDFPNIEYFEKGLWNKSDTLKFDNTKTSANNISTGGTIEVEVCALDEVEKGRIDFLKLDIEGAELKALEGAEHIIRKYRPKIAVCVYHNQTDFIKVPEKILGFNPDYKIFLRHYTQGIFETIMYFV